MIGQTMASENAKILSARTILIVIIMVHVISWSALYRLLHTLGADPPSVGRKRDFDKDGLFIVLYPAITGLLTMKSHFTEPANRCVSMFCLRARR